LETSSRQLQVLLLVVQPVQVNIRFSLVASVKAVGNGCSDRHGNAMQPARNPGAHVGVRFFSSGLAFFSRLTPMPVISAESWHELSFDTLSKVRGAREMPLHHSATVLSHLNY
jgi:hypothetical protein